MRTIAVIACLVLFSTMAASKKCTKAGYWGDNCSKLCGQCSEGSSKCNKVSGKCPSGKCAAGWTDKNAGQHKCDQPMCFGELGCDHEGECVAPNYCKCTGGGAMGQVVGVEGLYLDQDGNEIEGIQCISLRLAGLKGFFIALAVLIISISTCGVIERKKLIKFDKM